MISDMETYKLNLYDLIHDLGGPMACYRRLKAMQVHVKPRTLNKWIERDDIAAVYLVNLLAHEALTGHPVDLNKYIIRERDEPRLVRRLQSEAAPAAAAP